MKTHFVGILAYNHNHQKYQEVFINLSKINSIEPCGYKEGHSIIFFTDANVVLVKGTPKEILYSLYDRVPRGSMSITYSNEAE